MAALLAASLQGLAASGSPHANAKSMRFGTTPSVWLKGAFQVLVLPSRNLWFKTDNYHNPMSALKSRSPESR